MEDELRRAPPHMNKPVEQAPMDVQVVGGEVVITGPDAIGASLTAAAAVESGRRLQNAGRQIAAEAAAKPVTDQGK